MLLEENSFSTHSQQINGDIARQNEDILTNDNVFRASNNRDGKPMFTLSSLIKGRICVL